MELEDKLAEIVTLVESARAMPMSASCIVNRHQLLDLLEQLRALVPEELKTAQAILQDQDGVIEHGRQEAARIVAEGQEERARLVQSEEVYRVAEELAQREREAAAIDVAGMRAEVEEYVDTKLANFEIVLNKTLAAVLRGREKLGGSVAANALSDEGLSAAGEDRRADSFLSGAGPAGEAGGADSVNRAGTAAEGD